MMRLPIYAPPPVPAGQSVTDIRRWLEQTQASVQSCVAAVRTLQIPQQPAICPRDLGGGGSERDHSFKFTPDSETGATGGVITEGFCFVGGVLTTISSTPASWELSGVTTSIKYWVAVTYSTGAAVWTSGAAWPTSTAAVECFRILEITCAESVITSFIQRRCSDIHAGAATTEITVLTDAQQDTDGHNVQKKYRTAKVVSPGSESNWTTITNGDEVAHSSL